MHATSAEPQIDPEFLVEFGTRLKDAWNSLDADAVAAHCTEDVSWNDAGLPEPARGRAGVAAFVRDTARSLPDFHVEEQEDCPPVVSPDLPRVFVPYRMSGTMLGDWEPLGVAATNRRFSIEGIDQWTFRGELICHYTTYYDSIAIGRQLGLFPNPATVSHRAFTKLQHLQAAFLRRTAPRS